MRRMRLVTSLLAIVLAVGVSTSDLLAGIEPQPFRTGLFGITDRGTLEQGQAADVCVFDLRGLALQPAEIRRDLPEGASRLYQGAHGYRAVFVNGTQVLKDGEHTGAKPGRALWGPGNVDR